MIALEFVAVWLLVDFVSGVVHWAEDSYGTETTPVIGRWMVGPNLLHHRNGAAFVGKSHFIVVHVFWFLVWVVVNTGIIALTRPFDAYPFGLLGLLLGVEAILLSGFLLISQNRERQQEAIQAEIQYEIEVRNSRRIEQIERLVREIRDRLDARDER